MAVHVHEPLVDVDKADLMPGTWFLVDECDRVVASGDSARELIDFAKKSETLDIDSWAIDQVGPPITEEYWPFAAHDPSGL
ncbi:MAG: hypothetical protein AAFU85_22520 [Planctomycetota bacterium]